METQKIIDFVTGLYTGKGTFYFSENRHGENLYATCFAVLALDLINCLDRLSEDQKADITRYVRSLQDEKSGIFFDQSLSQSAYNRMDLQYIEHQLTDFALMSLQALKSTPKYQLRFLEPYKDIPYMKNWLEKLDWKNPWLVSNRIMFILNFLIHEQKNCNAQQQPCVEFVVNWLDENQDPATGFWHLGRAVSYHNQMAGAYHFLFYYTYLGRIPNCVERIVDSTLAVQDYDALFSCAGGGDSCSDLDAVDLLCRATLYTDYKRALIARRLSRTYMSLWHNQNRDGGFCWARRNKFSPVKILRVFNPRLLVQTSLKDFLDNAGAKVRNQVNVLFFPSRLMWKYSGLDKMQIKFNDSDIWSTWFRLLAIGFIEETFPEVSNGKRTFQWNFRKNPGLGFYK